MNREKLIRAGIAYDEGVARFAGKAELYEKYLRKLFQADTMDRLLEQLKKNDVSAAFKTAHDLKGNTGNLSVSALYHSVCELVELLRSENALALSYQPVMKQVVAQYQQAKEAVLEAEND